MKVICITDIHGYLETTLELIKALEKKENIELLEKRNWNDNNKLVINGDVFDRGPQNEEALEWVLNQKNVIYNIGNHEFFAMFPAAAKEFLSQEYFNNSTSKGLYWRDMPEEKRLKLLKLTADGRLKAAYQYKDWTYSHAGIEDSTVEQLNSDLREIGERLLEAYRNNQYESVQKEIVEIKKTSNGKEIHSQFPRLFDFRRTKNGKVGKGGIIWRRFDFLENKEDKQVVGHTKGRYMKSKGYKLNPQWRGNVININTIRDFEAGRGPVAITIQENNNLNEFTFSEI